MAVDPTAFYINQSENEAYIDTLIEDIHTKIDAIVTYLTEDLVSNYVTITSSSASQFNKELKSIEKDFQWYAKLGGVGETFRLKGAYADDYSNSAKECFVLDKVSIVNF